MKRLIYLPVVLTILIGCKQNDSKDSQKVIELEQRLRRIQDSLSQNVSKHGATGAVSNQPVSIYESDSLNTEVEVVEDFNPPVGNIERTKYVYIKVRTERPKYLSEEAKTVIHSSEITEVQDLSKKAKYKMMDYFITKTLEPTIRIYNERIIQRKVMVFDSYEDASEDRFANKNIF